MTPLNAGSDPEERLLLAARKGDLQTVGSLITAGADINKLVVEPDERSFFPGSPTITLRWHKKTPLMVASEHGRLDVVKLLIASGADVNCVDEFAIKSEPQKRTALSFAATNGHVDVVRVLIEAKSKIELADSDGTTPLARASWAGKLDVVLALLKSGANPNPKGSRSVPLHGAAAIGHSAIASALIDAGAKLERSDWLKTTPLMRAKANLEMVRLLIKSGAEVNAQSKDGSSALMSACSGDKHDINVVKELINSGADINLKDEKGETALDRASRYSKARKPTFEYLKSVGARLGTEVE